MGKSGVWGTKAAISLKRVKIEEKYYGGRNVAYTAVAQEDCNAKFTLPMLGVALSTS